MTNGYVLWCRGCQELAGLAGFEVVTNLNISTEVVTVTIDRPISGKALAEYEAYITTGYLRGFHNHQIEVVAKRLRKPVSKAARAARVRLGVG